MANDDEISVDQRLTFGTDAHAAAPDEDPENHLGEEVPDPWDDPQQQDWATTERVTGQHDGAVG